MKYLPLFILLFLFDNSFCQVTKITKEYNNGHIYAKGKVRTCPGFNKRYPSNNTYRKIGKWIYYHQNGSIKRIENYKNIKDCNSQEIPHGIWQYFNEAGTLIRQEEFVQGILWTADITKYCMNDDLAGEIKVRNGVRDTIIYLKENGLNLIKNGYFTLYFGQPALQINDGQNTIEEQIPFWVSPDANTPDYYNRFRYLKNVPNNLYHEYGARHDYVGMILYHKPTGHYSEYITGDFSSPLTINQSYCVKVRMRLSRNSGFYIDKLGIYISDSIPKIKNASERPKVFPQVLISQSLSSRDEWSTFCAIYTASGNEKHITIGRFEGLEETTVNAIKPINLSQGEYNQSAYYLVDQVELLTDTSKCHCDNKSVNPSIAERVNFDLLNPFDVKEFGVDKTYILKNIFFDFDKSVLLPDSYGELEKLFIFLGQNDYKITLSGHTDNIGSDEYNKLLSLARARAVANWLVAKGINENRIHVEGHGSAVPITENNSEENRATNRRVEFSINK